MVWREAGLLMTVAVPCSCSLLEAFLRGLGNGVWRSDQEADGRGAAAEAAQWRVQLLRAIPLWLVWMPKPPQILLLQLAQAALVL